MSFTKGLLIWLGWPILTVLGVILARWLLVETILFELLDCEDYRSFSNNPCPHQPRSVTALQRYTSGLILGLCMGIFQWIGLCHPQVLGMRARHWITATGIGWMLVFVFVGLSVYLTEIMDINFNSFNSGIFLVFMVSTLAVSVTQWIVLKKYVAHATWWILAHVLPVFLTGIIELELVSLTPIFVFFTTATTLVCLVPYRKVIV